MRNSLAFFAVLFAVAAVPCCNSRYDPATPESLVREVVVEAPLVFRETVYGVRQPRLLLLSDEFEVSVFSSGTAFAVDSNAGMFLMTATHVVSGEVNLAELVVDGHRYTASQDGISYIRKQSDRVRVGFKSAVPDVYVQPDSVVDLDIAVMRVDRADLEVIRTYRFGTPRLGERVRVLGYPQQMGSLGTMPTPVANLEVRELTVTGLEADYFVCQTERLVGPGFSGGPVLDSDDRVVGMAIRSNGNQIRCVFAEDLKKALDAFIEVSQSRRSD